MIVSFLIDSFDISLESILNDCVSKSGMQSSDSSVLLISKARNAEERNQIRKIAFDSQRKTRVKVDCLDKREIESYLLRASKYSWVDAELLRYAIGGSGYGSLCNAAIMAAAGSPSFVFDSRMKFDFSQSSASKNKIKIIPKPSSGFDPIYEDMDEVSVFDSLTDADRKVHRVELPEFSCDFGKICDCCTSSLCGVFGSYAGSRNHGSVFAVSMGTWGMLDAKSPISLILSRKNGLYSCSDADYQRIRFGSILQKSSKEWSSGNFKSRAFLAGKSASRIPFLPSESVSGGICGQSVYGDLSRRSGLGVTVSSTFSMRQLRESTVCNRDIQAEVNNLSITDCMSIVLASFDSGNGIEDIGRKMADQPDGRTLMVAIGDRWSQFITDSVKSRIMMGVSSSRMMDDLSMISDEATKIFHRRSGESALAATERLVPAEIGQGPNRLHKFLEEVKKFGSLMQNWGSIVDSVADLKKHGLRLGAYI